MCCFYSQRSKAPPQTVIISERQTTICFKHNDCNIYLLQLISIWPIIHLYTNNPLIVRIDFQSITVNATTYKYFHRASISFADCHILYSPITAMTLSLCDLLFRRHRQTYMYDNATEV